MNARLTLRWQWMPFYKDSGNIYRVSEFDALPWLIHGFGTRDSDIPGMFAHLATLKQIHSAECVAAQGRPGMLGQGDALLENTPGSIVAVKTADCIPLLLVDGEHRAVAAVHAGWRGTAAGIAQRAVEAMAARFGTKPRRFMPQSDRELVTVVSKWGLRWRRSSAAKAARAIDLAEENRRQ